MADNRVIIGALAGAGLTLAGIYLYKKNQAHIDEFLKSQGIDIPSPHASEYDNMDLKDLVLEKEKLEDLIAEREYNMKQEQDEKSDNSEVRSEKEEQ